MTINLSAQPGSLKLTRDRHFQGKPSEPLNCFNDLDLILFFSCCCTNTKNCNVKLAH